MARSVPKVNRKLRELASAYCSALRHHLGEDLISVVLYGSVARGEASQTSDIDLLIVAEGLPKGRFARKKCLAKADDDISAKLDALSDQGIETSLTRVLKTPGEASRVVPLYLDLVEDAVLLFDRNGFFKDVLARIRLSLEKLGARRMVSGRVRYWDLKPDLRPGERFEI